MLAVTLSPQLHEPVKEEKESIEKRNEDVVRTREKIQVNVSEGNKERKHEIRITKLGVTKKKTVLKEILKITEELKEDGTDSPKLAKHTASTLNPPLLTHKPTTSTPETTPPTSKHTSLITENTTAMPRPTTSTLRPAPTTETTPLTLKSTPRTKTTTATPRPTYSASKRSPRHSKTSEGNKERKHEIRITKLGVTKKKTVLKEILKITEELKEDGTDSHKLTKHTASTLLTPKLTTSTPETTPPTYKHTSLNTTAMPRPTTSTLKPAPTTETTPEPTSLTIKPTQSVESTTTTPRPTYSATKRGPQHSKTTEGNKERKHEIRITKLGVTKKKNVVKEILNISEEFKEDGTESKGTS